VPKVHNKPIKRPRKGSNKESKRQPKGSPGLAHRTIRCTREPNSELATFGNSGSCSAIIHWTVRCTKRSNGYKRQRSTATLQCAPARAEVGAAPEGAPDCPVAHMSEAPTVKTQRPGDVAGAPDCPVRHTTAASTNGSFGGWGYKYPLTTTLQPIQVFSLQTSYKSYCIQYKTQSKRSNPLPSPKIIPIK
jgi:hypothetical protein